MENSLLQVFNCSFLGFLLKDWSFYQHWFNKRTQILRQVTTLLSKFFLDVLFTGILIARWQLGTRFTWRNTDNTFTFCLWLDNWEFSIKMLVIKFWLEMQSPTLSFKGNCAEMFTVQLWGKDWPWNIGLSYLSWNLKTVRGDSSVTCKLTSGPFIKWKPSHRNTILHNN